MKELSLGKSEREKKEINQQWPCNRGLQLVKESKGDEEIDRKIRSQERASEIFQAFMDI